MIKDQMMYEVMIDCFLSLEGESLQDKDTKGILLAWVDWIDSRYKVAEVPDICYAIIDCEDGDVVSMINADIPDAKEKAREMCLTLNKSDTTPSKYSHEEPIVEKEDDDMVNVSDVADAFLNMDEEGFMDFLLGLRRGQEE